MTDASATGPRVSVVTAAFNAGAFIEVSLRSALDQSFSDLELVVIDDGSTDDTADVVGRLARTDPRVRLIRQENQGLAAARNHGIRESKGEMVAFLDNDDLWHPDKLALQIELLDERPQAAVASCYSALIDENHICLGWRYGGDANGDVYDEMLEWDMISGGSVALVRRDAFATVGFFDGALSSRSDWDMWIRLARRYPFATVPRVLVGYTRSPGNMSRDHLGMEQTGARVLDKVLNEDLAFDAERRRFCGARDLFGIACFCIVDGDVKEAWRYIYKSLIVSPLPILGRPRRWGVLAMLVVQTVLPARVYAATLGALGRLKFRLPAGRPFDELCARGRIT